ncbi:MAG: hypothetical protein KAH56_09940 [Candidatus Krumholzibacteria bacterium]|nr:hypothetical protein [Candidatus Krumholzibacteria bacterium]
MRSVKMVMCVLFVSLSLSLPVWAELIGVPDPTMSAAWMAYQGPEPLTLMITPDGTGGYFSDARTPDGTIADATITLLLMDYFNTPIGYFPREDIWIQSGDGGITFCGIYDLWPDTDTGPDGRTSWFQRPKGGRHSEEPMVVYVNGTPLAGPPLELYFNSPDITGNGSVDLTDVTWFTMDYFSGYHFRSDLHRDGVLNVSDVVLLAQWMGRRCE